MNAGSSLNLKVTGVITFLTLLLGVFSTLFYVSSYEDGVRRELIARGMTMAESLAMSLDEAVASENLDLISHLQKISYARDVLLAQVFTTFWLQLDSYPRSSAALPDPEAVRHFTNHQTTFVHSGLQYIDFYSPVFFNRFSKDNRRNYLIGYVRLRLSPDKTAAALHRGILGYAGIFLVATLATIAVLTLFLRKTVLKPLQTLQSAVVASASQELPSPVPVFGTDEIARLSRSFNVMCEALRERENRIREKAARLEEEVGERQSAQQALQQQAALLEHEVGIRRERERELELRNAELERFTYTVSHDLKSPLITIKGYAGAIQKDLRAGRYERVEPDLGRIAGAADKMAALLNDLLELSRIGRIMNTPSMLSLDDVVSDALAQLHGSIRQRGVEIAVCAPLPSVLADRPRITEVFQNLLENAIKYMGDQGHPRIEIGARQQGDRTVIYVADNGIGIAPEYHETVFGLFNKLDPRSEGTGIGLALVRRIIEFHRGSVWVESAGAGMGTMFCFTLGDPESGGA
jgi:signal transduction histidine kinase